MIGRARRELRLDLRCRDRACGLRRT